MERVIGNKTFAIQTKWIRITQNPYAPKYPCSGDFITLKGHKTVPDGRYLVGMVTEFEPPLTTDEEGLDVRISLADGQRDWEGLNGVNIRDAME